MTKAPFNPEYWLADELERVLEEGPAEEIEGIRQEFEKFLDQFEEETQRAAVILGAAQMDSLLRQALTNSLLPRLEGRKEEGDELFGTEKPLGSFGARIHASYRLGLVPRHLRQCLIFVKKIRNKFAHKVFDVDLEHSPCREWAEELVRGMAAWPEFTVAKDSVHGSSSEQERGFRAAVAYLCAKLHVIVLRCKGPRQEALVSLTRDASPLFEARETKADS